MTVVQFCDWCACVGCSQGNCCDHGKFDESGNFNPRQPHRLATKVVSGSECAYGGNFVLEDEFGNFYKWKVDWTVNPRLLGVSKILVDRIATGVNQEIFDIYPEKQELVKAFGEGLL